MNVYVRELSRHLGARGVAVDVFTRRQDADTPQVVEFGDNARVIHLEAGPPRPMDKYRVLEHLPQFEAGLEQFRQGTGSRYSLVHSHYWLSAPVAASLARRCEVPVVAMFHTLGRLKNRVSSNGGDRERGARIAIEREAMLRSDLVVAASPTDRDHMVRYYGAPASAIRVVPGGVDTEIFRPVSPRLARVALGMGPGPHILFVGRIQPLKGIDLLLRAFARLVASWADGPIPHLTVVGGRRAIDASDPEVVEMERLRSLASELGVLDQVTFRGAVPQQRLSSYYSAADVVAVPSLYESFGLVALEAMACGTPVVASGVGGLQWTVRDGETGLLIRKRSADAFSQAITRLLRDSALREKMSTAAMRVAASYSWGTVADRTLALYEELLPQPAHRMACCST